MARKIMIQGTMSNAGKSFITAGLLRIFKEDGFRAVPFKSQNMALNSFVTKDGLEIGRAQAMQAEAAGVEADIAMNPILLKPMGDSRSQVILMGEVYGNMSAAEYFKNKKSFVPDIMRAFDRLDRENDIIVLEGAGSPAEININSDDIVNFGMARMASSPVLLTGDIDPGGVFAQLYGTVMLLKDWEKRYLKGLIINKFRGDKGLLGNGLSMLKDLTGFPVLGVVPYLKLNLDEEDSLNIPDSSRDPHTLLDIAVIRFPRISNFTDLNSLSTINGASVRYVERPSDLHDPDMLILPGTKNTISDLKWLKETGFADAIRDYSDEGGVIFGICGGFQMLTESVSDTDGFEAEGEEEGLSFFPLKTVFGAEKTRKRTEGVLTGLDGILSGLNGCSFQGYEIHMGKSSLSEGEMVISNGNTYGTYIHGIFDSAKVRKGLISALAERKGLDLGAFSFTDYNAYKEEQFDLLSKLLRESLDINEIYRIMDEGI